MANNSSGAKRAVATKRKKYGDKVFEQTGALGGKARNASKKRYTPFSDPTFASRMGAKGSAKRWGTGKSEPDGAI